jgi:O-antigen/teichoic acid export membrane protein
MNGIYREMFFSTARYMVLKNIFTFIAGLGALLIIRLLPPEEYGKWALVWQLIATIAPILSFGLLSTLAKFLPEEEGENKTNLFRQSFSFVFMLFIFFGLIYFILINIFPGIFPIEIKTVKYQFPVFVGLLAFLNLYEGYYRGLGRFNQWTIIDGLRSMAMIISASLILFFYKRTFEIVFNSYFSVTAVFLFGICIFHNNTVSLGLPKIEKKIFNFSLAMLFGSFVYFLRSTMDFTILRSVLKNTAAVGYYAAGIRLPFMIETMFLSLIAAPLLYYFSHPVFGNNKERILNIGTRLLGVTFGFIAVVFFAFSKEIVILLFGNKYIPSIDVFRYFSITLFFSGYSRMIQIYFASINKPWLPLIVNIFSTLVYMLFTYLFVLKIGIFAPVIGHLILLFLFCSILAFILGKKNIVSIKEFFLFVCCILISVISGRMIHYFTAVPVYLLAIFAMKLVKYDDILLYRKILFKKEENA